jgi:hypothetical protein
MAEVAVMKKLLVALVGFALTACIIEEHQSAPAPPADTELQLDEVTNLGYACGGPLTSWTVTNRQTGDTGTAKCEQPVQFVGLAPGATYTFDIVGYSGDKLCWRGTCDAVAPAYTTSLVDCSHQIEGLCGL